MPTDLFYLLNYIFPFFSSCSLLHCLTVFPYNATLNDIDKRLSKQQAELLKLASPQGDYEKVGNEIYSLRDEKKKSLSTRINLSWNSSPACR